MSKKITIKDIARLASVSPTSVSLVLNDVPSRISESKKQEIRDIAKKLNYIPNHFARSLSKLNSKTIGLIVPNIESLYFSLLVKHIEEIMRLNGYFVFVMISGEKFENDKSLFFKLINRQVDGIIICPSNDSYDNVQESIKFFKENSFGIPVLFIERIFGYGESYVRFDNEFGGFLATKSLIEKFNSKNIACITENLKTYNGKEKYSGYVKALKNYNLRLNYNLVFRGESTYECGFKYAGEIIKDGSIDGIFCCSDLIAYGVMSYANFRKDLLKRMKIIGYGNLKQGEMFGINLNSIHNDVKLLSDESCKAMIDLIDGKCKRVKIILKPSLVLF